MSLIGLPLSLRSNTSFPRPAKADAPVTPVEIQVKDLKSPRLASGRMSVIRLSVSTSDRRFTNSPRGSQRLSNPSQQSLTPVNLRDPQALKCPDIGAGPIINVSRPLETSSEDKFLKFVPTSIQIGQLSQVFKRRKIDNTGALHLPTVGVAQVQTDVPDR